MKHASTLEIQVNGQPQALPGRVTVAELLARLGHAGKRVAVERNGAIIPRSLHGSTWVQPGDQIEIVIAVGGG